MRRDGASHRAAMRRLCVVGRRRGNDVHRHRHREETDIAGATGHVQKPVTYKKSINIDISDGSGGGHHGTREKMGIIYLYIIPEKMGKRNETGPLLRRALSQQVRPNLPESAMRTGCQPALRRAAARCRSEPLLATTG